MPSPRGSQKGRYRSWRKRRSSFLPASIVIILIAGISVLYWFAQKNAIEISSENLCPDSSNVPEVAAVLLDVTDKISPAEQVQIRQTIDEIKKSLPRFGHLRLYVLSHDVKFGQQAVVDLCNPGTGKNQSIIYQNPELARKRWKEQFSDVLDEALKAAAVREPSDRSEILEAIRLVAIEFLSDPENKNKKRSLFVVSDFVQHIPGGFSQYRREQVPADKFLSSQYARSVAMDLRDVDIELFYISRPQYSLYQTAQHKRFWATVLTEFGGNVTRMKRLFGGLK